MSEALIAAGHYQKLRVLGKGGYGVVYHAVHDVTGEQVALKCLTVQSTRQELLANAYREHRVLRQTSSNHIVQCLDLFEDNASICLVLEFVDGRELFEKLQFEGALSYESTRGVASGIWQGLQHIHSRDIVHRDLKAENIMVAHAANAGCTKVIDFGLAIQMPPGQVYATTLCGTPEYMPPEFLQQNWKGAYNPKAVDAYAFGALWFEMRTGLPPYYSRDLARLHRKIAQGPDTLVWTWGSNEEVSRVRMLLGHQDSRLNVINDFGDFLEKKEPHAASGSDDDDNANKTVTIVANLALTPVEEQRLFSHHSIEKIDETTYVFEDAVPNPCAGCWGVLFGELRMPDFCNFFSQLPKEVSSDRYLHRGSVKTTLTTTRKHLPTVMELAATASRIQLAHSTSRNRALAVVGAPVVATVKAKPSSGDSVAEEWQCAHQVEMPERTSEDGEATAGTPKTKSTAALEVWEKRRNEDPQGYLKMKSKLASQSQSAVQARLQKRGELTPRKQHTDIDPETPKQISLSSPSASCTDVQSQMILSPTGESIELPAKRSRSSPAKCRTSCR